MPELVCENAILLSFMKQYVFYKYKIGSQMGSCFSLCDLKSKPAIPDILRQLGLISGTHI